MRIVGRIDATRGLGFVSAYLMSARMGVNASLRFYVDTGASRTTIADRDAARIGISYSRLRKAPAKVSGVGGDVDAYVLPECMLVFEFSSSVYIEYLDSILVLRHRPRSKEEADRIQAIPSLLGVDVLKHFSVRFRDKTIVLER